MFSCYLSYVKMPVPATCGYLREREFKPVHLGGGSSRGEVVDLGTATEDWTGDGRGYHEEDSTVSSRPAPRPFNMFRATLLLLAAILSLAESYLPLASYIKPCSRNDPNLDECTLEHGKWAIPYLLKGDPKYETPVLNPMEILEIRLEDVDKDKKSTGVDITLRNLKIYGLDRFELKKARFDLKNQELEIAGNAPHIGLVFQYEIDGKILLQPILGQGNGIINMTDVNMSYTNDYSVVTRENGLEYMKPGDHKFDYDTKNMLWKLDNLFGGDTTLGNFTNQFLNVNWDVLNEEMGPYLAQAIGEVIKGIVTSVMKLVSYDTIFPEKL